MWNWNFFSSSSFFNRYYMIYDNVGGIRIPWSRIWHKDISILTETHINHDQIHHQIHVGNNWLGPIFLFPGDTYTKGLLALLHPGLEGITEADTYPKRRFVSFKVTSLPLMCLWPIRVWHPVILVRGAFLWKTEIVWKIKTGEMKTK